MNHSLDPRQDFNINTQRADYAKWFVSARTLLMILFQWLLIGAEMIYFLQDI